MDYYREASPMFLHRLAYQKWSKINKERQITNIVDKIYILESSGGKNDGFCKSRGGVNGFGYRQNAHERVCYNTYETVRALVTAWVTDKLDNQWSIAKTVCYYNRGSIMNDCPYYQNYLIL